MSIEQSEQDFREVERARDLPPDEPYPYGLCPTCGRDHYGPCEEDADDA